MRSPYNLAAGPRRYIAKGRFVVDATVVPSFVTYLCTAWTEQQAAQIADALELVDRMRNHP